MGNESFFGRLRQAFTPIGFREQASSESKVDAIFKRTNFGRGRFPCTEPHYLGDRYDDVVKLMGEASRAMIFDDRSVDKHSVVEARRRGLLHCMVVMSDDEALNMDTGQVGKLMRRIYQRAKPYFESFGADVLALIDPDQPNHTFSHELEHMSAAHELGHRSVMGIYTAVPLGFRGPEPMVGGFIHVSRCTPKLDLARIIIAPSILSLDDYEGAIRICKELISTRFWDQALSIVTALEGKVYHNGRGLAPEQKTVHRLQFSPEFEAWRSAQGS